MNSLRPNSVCDTTPLRRFESQSSSSEPSSPALNNQNNQNCSADGSVGPVVGGCNSLVGVTIIAKNQESIPALTNHHNHHHHNHNNNNKIEVGLNNFGVANSVNGRKMDYQRQINRGVRQLFLRIFCDLCILACVVLPIYGLQAWGVPRDRGFFCSDETLKFPYHPSTLKNWHMTLMCLVVPITIITLVEFFKAHDQDAINYETTTNMESYYICQLPIPNWLLNCYQKIGFLIFGAGISKLTVDIAKYSIGRLRPYFFAECVPIMSDGTTCKDPINFDRYIEDFTCQGVAERQRDIRLSFPSGHTNLAFFTMVYIVIYLQRRMSWQGSKMFKHLLQFLLLMFAWYTALTRVSDYRHHYTDVIAGAAIGSTYAFIVTCSLW